MNADVDMEAEFAKEKVLKLFGAEVAGRVTSVARVGDGYYKATILFPNWYKQYEWMLGETMPSHAVFTPSTVELEIIVKVE